MDESDRISAAFKALGEPIRLRLFALIAAHDELCVCHLTHALALPQSTVSRQLGVLRHAGLVATRRDGKWMYYRTCGPLAPPLVSILNDCLSPLLQDDRCRLQMVRSDCSDA
ncbi:helix-turn-helix transcriptional regulator [Mariprofundus erugo]|uniref:Helix-turn-helix transcriptional regulator n=1 Tax=Mariprofundus erugo TaxID=2528639 RepID=A0A5R9GUV0_9PROT|nr:metalloregulator ArsR/SmtB family transcription factor [Mariprofundus erugo]TLS68093.1 helix-turn-helix transcriptional regulator [Mariprofundus erugo]TLS75816.1 helix-turn-helix transcriptional regulator [Mariprofundus erugo]